MAMNKTVLIFGVGGFVGAYLAREFCHHGYAVYGSDVNHTDSIPDFVDFAQADLTDAQAVARVVEAVSPTHMVNLAAISSVGLSWKIPQKTVAINVEGAINLLEATRRLGTEPRILLVGSSEEYAVADHPIHEDCPIDASNPYGLSKVLQERFSELYRDQYGMKVYHVRPFNHTGVGQSDAFVIPSWCKQVVAIEKSGAPGTMRVGNLDVKRDFSNVKDMVRAYRLIIEGEDCGAVYNVGSGVAIAMRDILDFIVSRCTQPVRVEVDPALFRPADNPIIQCDPARIRRDLGWTPQISLWDTIEEMMAFYRGGADAERDRR